MKRPAFQFYPADWRNNANLRRCSPAARGVWMDLLCVLHDSDEYGIVRWPLADLCNAASAPLKLVRELADKSVLKGSDTALTEPFVYTPRHGRKDGEPVTLIPTQAGPVWYSSRMVRDEHVRANAGAATRFTAEEQPVRTAAPGSERANLRARVLSKTSGCCYHCSAFLGDVWEIDHLMPRAKGGTHTFANLVPSCVRCNQDKSDTLPDDWNAPGRAPTRRLGAVQGDGSTSSSSSSATQEISKLTLAPARPSAEAVSLAVVAKSIPDCPHQQILALWAEVLPVLPQHLSSQWKGARADHLRARWKETAQEKGWLDPAEGLTYFRRLFAYIGQSRFLTGRAQSPPGKAPFAAELAWIVLPQNWAKVHEGKYHQDAA